MTKRERHTDTPSSTKRKRDVMRVIEDRYRYLSCTQEQFAKITGVLVQSRVSSLLRGESERFTLDYLLDVVEALGGVVGLEVDL